MADLSKLKRRNSLGDPPPPSAAGENLAAPEVAPPPAEERVVPLRPTPVPPAAAPAAAPEIEEVEVEAATRARKPAKPRRIDGRTLRKTGRTVQFSSKVSERWDTLLRETARAEGVETGKSVLLVEILEKALDMYVASRKKKGA
jgi:hypothetical protein